MEQSRNRLELILEDQILHFLMLSVSLSGAMRRDLLLIPGALFVDLRG